MRVSDPVFSAFSRDRRFRLKELQPSSALSAANRPPPRTALLVAVDRCTICSVMSTVSGYLLILSRLRFRAKPQAGGGSYGGSHRFTRGIALRSTQRPPVAQIPANLIRGRFFKLSPPSFPANPAAQAPTQVHTQEVQTIGTCQARMVEKTGVEPGEILHATRSAQLERPANVLVSGVSTLAAFRSRCERRR